jgi:cell division septation protein DedD
MDISRYLVELIRKRNELIVPGLGTFHREELPAYFDQTTQSFMPPSEKVVFSTEHAGDNSLLDYISLNENISRENAENFIREYVNNLNDLLSTTELIKIDFLGTFENGPKGLVFEADPDLIPNAYFGLKAQKETGETQEIDEKIADDVVEQQSVEEFEEELDAVEESSSSKTWIFVLALLLACTAIVQVLYPNLISSLLNPKTEPIVVEAPIAQQDTVAVDSLTITDSVSNSIAQDSSKITVQEVNQESSYEIVIAAFGKRSEADEFIQDLAQRNIKAKALETRPGKFIKISVGSFADQESAQTELKKIQSELSRGAWIYHVKPKKSKS